MTHAHQEWKLPQKQSLGIRVVKMLLSDRRAVKESRAGGRHKVLIVYVIKYPWKADTSNGLEPLHWKCHCSTSSTFPNTQRHREGSVLVQVRKRRLN